MAEHTQYYNLIKPLGTEQYNIEDQNDNMDIIDEQLKLQSDTIATKLDYTQMNLGQDLNQIFGIGLYRSPSNVSGVSTILNKPSSVTNPFVLIVSSNDGASTGGIQTIFYGANIFSRRGTSAGWGVWYKYTGVEE